MTARTLAERLAAVRGERQAQPLQRPRHPALHDRSAQLASWFGARLGTAAGGAAVILERSVALPDEVVRRLAMIPDGTYFDTETTGLSTGAGTVIFLAGIGRVEDGRFVSRQFLLPDYPHEAAMLRLVAAELSGGRRMVTYNGRGFDLPLLTARLTMNGLFPELAGVSARHDDLLPLARRLFRRPLGGARLAEVEAALLGVRRTSDCSGAEVPERYFGYLRGGSPDLLRAVLDHNLQDIVSLALLEAEIGRLADGAWRTAPILDPRGMAIHLLRAGDVSSALELLDHAVQACADPPEAVALRRLATRLLLAAGRIDEAEALWRSLTARASLDAALAWIEVARIRERSRGDLRGALQAAEAAQRVLDLAFALGRGGGMLAIGRVRLQVDARLRRLRRWVAAAERREQRLVRRRVA